MRLCSDCGGDVGRGWTVPSDHLQCASCEMARALGSPIPPRPQPTYWQTYYQRRKARMWKAVFGG